MNDSVGKIQAAKKAMEDGDYASGMRLASEVLDVEPNNPHALYGAAYALMMTGKNGPAHHLFMRCATLDPDKAGPWNNAGMAMANNHHWDAAEACYREALNRDPDDKHALQNMALVYLNKAQPAEALKWIRKAEATGKDTWHSTDTKALANIALRRWQEGWKAYRETAGIHKQRPIRDYCGEPMWEGQKGTVVVYGNQGLGDEIAFASCIPDATRQAEIILDCDHRLEGLFKRSFDCKVYGTRHLETRDWEHAIDYSTPIDCLPSLYRNRTEDFPGTPYLVADPERRVQWKALFDTYRKPVIGIAWNGGLASTGGAKRSMSLEELLPLFRAIDATWVSLEYKDRASEIEEMERIHGVRILDYPRATRTNDYDDTAGLVAELDLVVSVTTAVVILAGALGKECWCIAPNQPGFFYGLEGDLPWFKSVKMFRQSKDWPIEDMAKLLKLRYGSV